MNKSESTKNLAAKLIKFQQENVQVIKDSVNPHFKNRYASLNAYLDSIMPALSKIGVAVTQFPVGNTLVTHVEDTETGEWMQAEYPIRVADQKPQEIASSVTYGRRYTLAGMFMLGAEDDDGNEASGMSLPKLKNDDKKTWLNAGSKEYSDALAAIKAGKATVDSVITRYNLSGVVLKQLVGDTK